MLDVEMIEPIENSNHNGMKSNLHVCGKVPENFHMVMFDFKRGTSVR